MSKPAGVRQQALGVTLALIAFFGLLVVGLCTVFDWKTVFVALATCPVGVVLLWLSRDTIDPRVRIALADTTRAQQRARAAVAVPAPVETARAA